MDVERPSVDTRTIVPHRIKMPHAETARPEVIVVGAGPVGLSLALGLAGAGRRVLVLEKEPTTAEHSRAPAIWPRTQEILAELGVLDSFVAEGIALPRVALTDSETGRELLALPLEELADETPFPRLLIVPQSKTERLLREALDREETATTLFSAEAIDVEQDDSGVRVPFRLAGGTRTVRAAFAVGCDGAHSTVREALGASFDGGTYRMRAALADVRPRREPEELPFPRLCTRGGVAVAIRMDERTWRLILPFRPGEFRPLDHRVERAAVRLFPAVRSAADYETVWQSEFHLHRRVSSVFASGRIALAGDAAHLNSPVGGQGMNAGIQDAAALTSALLEALERDDARPLLAYERARRTAVERGVNVFTDRLTRGLLFRRGRALRPVLRLASLALRIPPLRRRLLRRVAMLDGR